MEPLHQNLLAAVATVVYVKTTIGSCDFMVSRRWLPSKISRKIIHISAGSWIIFWNLFTTEHWTWRLNVLVPAIYSIQLLVKGAILRDRNDTDVKTMTRTGDPTELLYGPLYFTLVMITIGLTMFRQEVSICIMACLGFGDGLAPLVGTYFPFGYYLTYPFGPNDRKTLSGSLGFFAGTLLGFYVLRSMIEIDDPKTDWTMILQVASVATVTEGIAGKYDNLFIPTVAYCLHEYLL